MVGPLEVAHVALGDVAVYCTEKISTNVLTTANYISTENMIPNKAGILEATSLPKSDRVNKYSIGDILISNIRPYFKKIWLADCEGGCSADVLVLRVNEEVCREYIYYCLLDDNFFDYVMVGSKGVKMPRGDKNQILKYEIPLPKVEIQREIATKIGSIDARIASNLRLATYLDEYCKLLFHKWFIEFNYPDANGGSYRKSNTGFREVEGEKIPIGWKVSTVSDECKLVMGQSPPSETYNENGDGLPFYQGVVDFGKKYPTVSTWCSEPTRKAIPGEVLLSVRAPVGSLNVAIEKCCIGRGIASISLMNTYNYYAFYEIQRRMNRLMKQGNGTVFDSIRKEDIQKLPFLIPSEGRIESYEIKAHPIQQKIKICNQENYSLIEMRDLLIKKLIKL